MKLQVSVVVASLLLVASVSVYAQDKRLVITPENASTLTEIARLGQGHVEKMLLSPDGTQVAFASDTGLRVWDSTKFTTVETLDHKVPAAGAVAYSPDGKSLAVADFKVGVQILDVETGKVTQSFQLDNRAESLAFHPSRQELVTGGFHGGQVWDIASGNKIADLNGSNGSIVSIVFTTDGKLITGASDEKITYWDDSYHQINEIKPTDGVNDFAIDPQNPNRFDVVTDSFSDIVTVDGTNVHEQQLKIENAYPNAVSFSHDSKFVAEGWTNGHVYIRDAETGDQVHEFTGGNSVLSIQFTPKDDKIWAISYDDNLYVWDVASGKLDTKLGLAAGEMTAVAFSPDGKKIVAAGKDDGYLHFWDAATFDESAPLDDGRVNNSIAVSLDGKYLATGGAGDFHIHVWNIADGTPALDLAGHTETVNSVAFSPDGKMLASGSDDQSTRVWDVQTGKLLYSITDPKSMVTSVIFTTDSTTLLTSTFDGSVYLYNATSGKHLADFKPEIDIAKTLSINADTTLLAVGGIDDGRTYNLTPTQKLKPTPATVSLSGRHMVFDPAGDLFAAALDHLTYDPTLVLIDLKVNVGQRLAAIKDITPNAIVFSPDGTLLASAQRSGYVVLYGVKS